MSDSLLEKYLENSKKSPVNEWAMNSFQYQLLKMVIEESAKGRTQAQVVIRELTTNLAKCIFIYADRDTELSLEGIKALTGEMENMIKGMDTYLKTPGEWKSTLPCGKTYLEGGVVSEDGRIDIKKLDDHAKVCKPCAEFLDTIKGKRGK